ncbi:hypothetical protein ERO13_D11G153701v2 [Gossypium hirsutum]|uniref:Uncharacterized protein n=2 Tax=Gossypium TaxID=3633 RepID=A0A5J5PAW7_GOSBA|nr:hypothetical protein ES319_D11G160600v1 [Gossypium barbadense]KAG4120594.1 hypothetical protein ERO13_D11G153701v2 [Gossypium hirsutum]TYG45380.1 hypothetical protein ES288_D11G169200v1 [Gossypium darwinii]
MYAKALPFLSYSDNNRSFQRSTSYSHDFTRRCSSSHEFEVHCDFMMKTKMLVSGGHKTEIYE